MNSQTLEVIGVIVFICGVIELFDVIRGKSRWKGYMEPVCFILIGIVFFFLGHGPIHIS